MHLFTLYRYYFTNITVSEGCQKGVRSGRDIYNPAEKE